MYTCIYIHIYVYININSYLSPWRALPSVAAAESCGAAPRAPAPRSQRVSAPASTPPPVTVETECVFVHRRLIIQRGHEHTRIGN